MKRFFGCVLVVAGITLAFSVNAVAAGGSLRLVILISSVAIAQSQWGKRISDDLKKEHEKLAGTLEQKKRAFVTAKDDYEKKKEAMDGKARDRKEKELAGHGYGTAEVALRIRE